MSDRNNPERKPVRAFRTNSAIMRHVFVILCLLSLIVAAMLLRWSGSRAAGFQEGAPYWAESAQHFRYFRMVADGAGIPWNDVEIEAPDPFLSRSQTIFGEQLAGVIARWLRVPQTHYFAFIKWYVRSMNSLALVAVFLIARALGLSAGASLLSAATFGLSFATVFRSLGDRFFHEHTALTFVAFHFAFLVRALRNGRWRDNVAASILLILALLGWKVVRFIHLEIVLWFWLMFLLDRLDSHATRTLTILTCTAALFSLLPFSWLGPNFEFYLFSPAMALGAGLLVGRYLLNRLGQEPESSRGIWRRFGGRLLIAVAALSVTLVVVVVVEGAGEYEHVWSVLRARLAHFRKPATPSLLDIEARHYWAPPYTTPHLLDFLEEAFIWVLLLIPILVWRSWRWIKRETSPAEALVLMMSWLGIAGYFTFEKMLPLLILPAAPLIAMWPRFLSARWGRAGRNAGVTLICVALALNAYHAVAWDHSILTDFYQAAGVEDAPGKRLARVTTSLRANRLLAWIDKTTPEDATILCEFPLAPSILAYTGRATNQHAYFESGFRRKYLEFATALFGDERALWRLCRRWETDYLVYNAHMLLRTDTNMSYRYVTDNIPFDWDWVCAKLHFQQEKLDHFDLLYQNDFFRVFRVLDPDERPSRVRPEYEALFDEALFRREVDRDADGRPLTGEWLYPFVDAMELFELAFETVKYATPEKTEFAALALKQVNASIDVCPHISKAYTLKGMLHHRLAQLDQSVTALNRALELNPHDERAYILRQRIHDYGGKLPDPTRSRPRRLD